MYGLFSNLIYDFLFISGWIVLDLDSNLCFFKMLIREFLLWIKCDLYLN